MKSKVEMASALFNQNSVTIKDTNCPSKCSSHMCTIHNI
jgi:hypothetical protein